METKYIRIKVDLFNITKYNEYYKKRYYYTFRPNRCNY